MNSCNKDNCNGYDMTNMALDKIVKYELILSDIERYLRKNKVISVREYWRIKNKEQ